ncbi:mandelate racemase/muconate lactonizing enzyme family protein [Marinobacterium arenosum]|uniref:mandelate racemase/muconate lactonizing enzyme family protein n=1 Tax=Marinobacterium arenosum TaxID=2862496 RepID=UPI001C958A02|nr:mandelate racemase/muconate lactonizing enzyme family protein [Marinobacterium arenosum]MBY4677436.1 mandelate racemase/muconate lactonizing enzyme family protein [Marinobacterium arenosum]
MIRIIDIEVIELRVPGKRQLDLDPTDNGCLIRIHTDAGISGIAEVDSLPSVIKAIVEAPPRIRTLMGLKSILVGEDPRDIAGLWQKMYHHTSYCGRRGVVMHAISGIDIALWDLLGKLENKPVSQLLGQPQHQRLPAYITVYPLGGTVDELQQALDHALQYPVRALKLAIDPFWREQPALATELLCAARKYVGDEIELMLDATASFANCQQLEPLLPVLRDCQVRWLEAPFPLDEIDQYRQLKEAGIPVGAGDTGLTAPAEWRPYFEQGQIDIAQPDISWVGGFTALQQLAEMAARAGSRLIPHGWNTDLTLAANLQFLAVQPLAEYAEFSTSASPLRWQLAKNGPGIDSDGMIPVPQGPGLGVTLNEETVARYRVR